MPAQDGLGRDERRELIKQPSTQDLAADSEATPVVITQAKPTAANLPLQDAVFFEKKVEHLQLVPIQAASEHQGEGMENRGHGGEGTVPGEIHEQPGDFRCWKGQVVLARNVVHRPLDSATNSATLGGFVGG